MLGSRNAGIVFGLISSACFGLIPLFTLPLMARGIPPESSLFYRFSFAALITLGVVLIQRKKPILTSKNIIPLALTSLHYALAALCLFIAYKHLPSGTAATIFFSYPIMVMFIMVLFHGEAFSWSAFIAALLALPGVGLLSWTAGEIALPGASPILGVILSLASALTCGLYIINIARIRVNISDALTMLVYVFFASALYILIYTLAVGKFVFLTTWTDFALIFMLALLTAFISNITLIWSVERIGSTLASLLGALEPLTCVVIGIFVFNEPSSPAVLTGIALIIFSVCLIMAAPWLTSWKALHQRQPRQRRNR